MRLILFVIMSILAFVGCCGNDQIEESLQNAERIMDEQPDSAILLLKSIDGGKLRNGSRQQARYALLYTKAQYKTYEDPASDSLINLAVDYYEEHGSGEEKFYAYLYQGIIRSILGNKRQALHSLFRASYNYEYVEDHYHKGQLFMYLSSHYAGLNNREFLRFSSLASQEYAEAELTTYYLNSKVTEATARLRLFDLDGAKTLLDSIHTIAFAENDTISICEILSAEANLAFIQGDLESAGRIYNQLEDCYGYMLTDQDMGNISNILAKQSKVEAAQEQMASARQLLQTEGDSLLYYANMLILSKELQDNKSIINYQDSLLLIFQHLYITEQEHAEYAEKCDYLELKRYQEDANNRIVRGYLVFGLISLVFIVLLMASVIKKNRIMAKMQKEIIENLRLELALQFQERTDALSLLKNEILAKVIKSKIEDKRGLTIDEQNIVNQLFDQYLPDFQKSLIRLVNISNTELMVCYLLKIGLLPNEIAILLNKTAQAISQIRTRLYTKVFQKKGKPLDWDTFIHSI